MTIFEKFRGYLFYIALFALSCVLFLSTAPIYLLLSLFIKLLELFSRNKSVYILIDPIVRLRRTIILNFMCKSFHEVAAVLIQFVCRTEICVYVNNEKILDDTDGKRQ